MILLEPILHASIAALFVAVAPSIEDEVSTGAVLCENADGEVVYEAENMKIEGFTEKFSQLTLVKTESFPAQDFVLYSYEPGGITCFVMTV